MDKTDKAGLIEGPLLLIGNKRANWYTISYKSLYRFQKEASEVHMTAIYTKNYEVTPEQAASAVGSGGLPVLATPALIALMENACYTYSQEVLIEDPQQTSVGAKIEVNHLLASPIKGTVQVVIDQVHQEGRHIHFEMTAYVQEKQVATGLHERVIIDPDRLLAKVDANFIDEV